LQVKAVNERVLCLSSIRDASELNTLPLRPCVMFNVLSWKHGMCHSFGLLRTELVRLSTELQSVGGPGWYCSIL